jgi:hypothetical protein
VFHATVSLQDSSASRPSRKSEKQSFHLLGNVTAHICWLRYLRSRASEVRQKRYGRALTAESHHGRSGGVLGLGFGPTELGVRLSAIDRMTYGPATVTKSAGRFTH